MSATVSEAALGDADRAVRMYNGRPGKHGGAFRAEFRSAVRRIAADPRRFPPVEDAPAGREYRELLIDRFGQRVIFRMDGDAARVVAVIHVSAAPTRWHRRADA